MGARVRFAGTVDERTVRRKTSVLCLEATAARVEALAGDGGSLVDALKAGAFAFAQMGVWATVGNALAQAGVVIQQGASGLPHKAVPVSKLESGAHLPASELAEVERKLGQRLLQMHFQL